MKKNTEEKTHSKFNRKIASENIPAIKIIRVKYDDEQKKLNYKSHQEIDMDRVTKIFTKEEEAFRPFKRKKLKEAIERKVFNCENKEEFIYDAHLGLITNYEEHKYSKFGNPIMENFLIMIIA